jgi:Tol biopolymer transport system component
VDLLNRRQQLGLINVADGTMRVLKTIEGGLSGSPKLSPDNRFVAYTHVKSESALNHDVHVISVEDGHETALVAHDAQDLNPVWTPDGRGIVFASNRRGAMDLWFLAVTDGQRSGAPVMVKSDLPSGSLPGYLFGFNSAGSLFFSQRLGFADVFLSGVDPRTGRPQGELKKAVDASAGTNLWPTLSPDGRMLATFRNAGYESFIHSTVTLRDLSTGSERNIPTVLPAVASARWGADGKTLVIRSVPGGQMSLFYELDARTGDVRLMLSETRLPVRMAYHPWCLSPDSGTLYFAGYEKLSRDAYRLMALDVTSGQTREVVRETNTISQLGCSHDGERLAYSVALDSSYQSSELKVVASKGGQPRVILASTSEADAAVNIMTPIQWSPDGTAVYYQAVIRKPRLTQDLIRVPVEGGPPERMGLQLEPFSVPEFSRDGRFVAFRGAQQAKKELWSIDNFLPKK